MTRRLLTESGHWSRLEPRVTARGVFKPTVNDVANDVKLGSVDAGIVWDSTAVQYPELSIVHVPELDRGTSLVEIGVLRSSRDPAAALRFARFVGARDEGLKKFREDGFRGPGRRHMGGGSGNHVLRRVREPPRARTDHRRI